MDYNAKAVSLILTHKVQSYLLVIVAGLGRCVTVWGHPVLTVGMIITVHGYSTTATQAGNEVTKCSSFSLGKGFITSVGIRARTAARTET